jgi:hypothetical protein
MVVALSGVLVFGGCSSELDLSGTFVGAFTVSIQPSALYDVTLKLNQENDEFRGSMLTTSGRSASVVGAVLDDNRATMVATFTDGCDGTVRQPLEILSSGDRLLGSYEAVDCVGSYSGMMDLKRQ